jgi:hypothetical protein
VDEPQINPFTIPVGILLYRVARNMRESGGWKKRTGSIRTLLENSLRLLEPQKHSQVWPYFLISFNYLYFLSDRNLCSLAPFGCLYFFG